jgi:hypothetical protein
LAPDNETPLAFLLLLNSILPCPRVQDGALLPTTAVFFLCFTKSSRHVAFISLFFSTLPTASSHGHGVVVNLLTLKKTQGLASGYKFWDRGALSRLHGNGDGVFALVFMLSTNWLDHFLLFFGLHWRSFQVAVS